MKPNPLSRKQRDFLLHSTSRINIAYGSVRSGKTFVSLLRWLHIVATAPEGAGLMMCAKTHRTLDRNLISILTELLLPREFSLNRGLGECRIYGKRVYLTSFNDERAQDKLRGVTLYAAYIDEATLAPQSFVQMLLSRLSEPNAIVLATTNPDSPSHYLKKDFIDRADELDIKCWHFTLDDNDSLAPDYVAAIKKEYTGLWYKRYILGEFSIAEGVVYDMFDESNHVTEELPKRFTDVICGVDYGISNPTAFIALGLCADSPLAGKWLAFKEFYYDGKAGRQKTDKELSDDLKTFLQRDGGQWYPSSIEVDPSAASFKVQLKRDGFANVHDADNSVLDGIRNVASMLSSGQLLIHRSCKNLLKEIPGYSWDPKKQDQGQDAPIKINDHVADALRYSIRRAVKRRFS